MRGNITQQQYRAYGMYTGRLVTPLVVSDNWEMSAAVPKRRVRDQFVGRFPPMGRGGVEPTVVENVTCKCPATTAYNFSL